MTGSPAAAAARGLAAAAAGDVSVPSRLVTTYRPR